VRKSGNMVRITAQLISADDGFHLWSKTYDLYLRAKDALYTRTLESIRLSIELFEEAYTLDPLNRVANGNYVIHLADNGDFDGALRTVNRLIRTDPGYDFYHLVRTNLHLSTYDLTSAAQAVTTVKLTDRAIIFIMMRMFLAFNDVDNYLEFLGMVPIDNPQYELLPYMEMSFTATTAELRAEAEVALLRQQPDLPFWLMFGLMDHGEWALVKEIVENARPYFADEDYTSQINGEDPNFPYMLALHELGETERARDFAKSLLDYQKNSHILGPRGKGIGDAACHMVLGNYEKAVAAYIEAIDAGWLEHYQFRFTRNDLFEDFFEDARIQQSIKRIDAELEKQRPAVYETLREAGLVTSL